MSEHSNNDFEGLTYKQVNEDIIRTLTTFTWKYWTALAVTGTMVIIGALTYYYQSVNGLGVWGTNEPIFWGLDIPSFIFWIGFSLSGTLLSAILLLTKSHWRNPIYRAAEITTGLALMTAGVVVLTHMGRPWRFWYAMPYPNMRFLWSNFRSPLTADILGMASYLTASLLFLIVGSIPDFAILRDHTLGWRKKMYTVLSMGWKGSDQQWLHFRRAYVMIACLIIPVAVAMHSVTSWVPSMTINPGSHSTIYPMYFVTGALLSGAAGVVMILTILRKALHLEKYFKVTYLDHLSKLVLLAGMTIAYIYLIEIFVPSYKESNFEFMPMAAKLYGKYGKFFWPMVFFNSVFTLAFFSQKVRRSPVIAFIICSGVQVGMYFERFLMVIPSLSVGPLPSTWSSYHPTWVEFVLLGWGLSIFIFLFLAVSKIIPVVSMFEVKELLRAPKRADLPEPERVMPHPTMREIFLTSPTRAEAPDELVYVRPMATNLGAAALRAPSSSRPLMAIFAYVDDTVAAIEKLDRAGFEKLEVQSPVPNHDIDHAMEKIRKYVPWSLKNLAFQIKNRNIQVIRFSFFGAAAGFSGALLLGGGTAVLYPIQSAGLPILALPSIGFTAGLLAALGGLIFSVVGLFFLARIPSFKLKFYDAAVSNDRFAVLVNDCDASRLEMGTEILQSCGAERIVEMA